MNPVHQALQALVEVNGNKITPELVVDAARNPESPLHRCFEWDDSIAAEKFRLEQSRAIIRQYKVQITTESSVVRVPALVRDPDVPNKSQGYIPITAAQRDERIAREVLADELARVKACLYRALSIAEALDLKDEVNETILHIEKLERGVSAH